MAAARMILRRGRWGSSFLRPPLFAPIFSNTQKYLPSKPHRPPVRSYVFLTPPDVKIPLPDPDGGSLVDLVVPEADRAARRAEAATLPAVTVGPVDVEWAHVLADGWASPLSGFMRESEYLQSLHFSYMRVRGTTVNMSLPIVLAINDDQKGTIQSSSLPSQLRYDVALLRPSGELFAVLRSAEIYRYNKEERIVKTWQTRSLQSPYVKEVICPAGDWLIGGDLQVLEPIAYKDGLDHYRLSPRQLRKEFDRLKADAVVAFQLSDPFHNGHVLSINDVLQHVLGMGYKNPVLLLHPLGGFTQPRSLPLAVLMEQYCKVLEDGVLDSATTVLAIFPSPMNYPGRAELQWHAKARTNAGANFYIIDDEPLGFGAPYMFYLDRAHTIFHFAPGLDRIHGYPYWPTAYDKEEKKMVFPDADKEEEDYIFISEAEVRRFAINGRAPEGFMCASGWKVLSDYYKSSKVEESVQSYAG